MRNNDWGVGDKKDAKAFDTVFVNKQPVELVFGENPHSTQDNNIYARFSSGQIGGFDGHRVCVGMEIEEYNYLKESELSGSEVRKACRVKVLLNGKQCFDGFHRNYSAAYKMAQEYVNWAMEPQVIQVWKEEEWQKLIGRRIYYRDQAAVVDSIFPEQNCIIVKPDGNITFRLSAPQMENKDDYPDEDVSSVEIELNSPHIWWWRK